MGLAAFAALSCLAWGLPASAQASTVPVIDSESASNITSTDATLEAFIDSREAPAGDDYQFQLVANPSEFASEILCPAKLPPASDGCDGAHSASALPIGFHPSSFEHLEKPVSLDLASAGVTLKPGTTYHYRMLVARNVQTEDTIQWEAPIVYGPDQTFTTPPRPPSIESESVSHISPTDATLEAQINPGGLETTYEFRLETPECQMMAGPGPAVGCQLVGSGTIPAGTSTATVSTDIAKAWQKLTPNTTYLYVVFARNSVGPASGRHEGSFKTAAASPPSIESESLSHLTSTDATLEAQIDTEGLESTYNFYLQEAPLCFKASPPCERPQHEPVTLPSGSLLGSFVPQSVSVELNSADVSLSPGEHYEYWVTATSPAGTTTGLPQEFTAPEDGVQPLNTTKSSGSESTTGPAQNAGQGTVTPGATDPVGNVTPLLKMTVLTNAQKLAKAARVCKRKPRKQRTRCEKQAHNKYGTATNKTGKQASTKGNT